MGKTFITSEDIEYLHSKNSEIADFCIRCNQTLKEFNMARIGKEGFDLPDPTATAVAIWDDLAIKKFKAYAFVETKNESTYGQFVIDQMYILGKEPNVTICQEIDAEQFKKLLFERII